MRSVVAKILVALLTLCLVLPIFSVGAESSAVSLYISSEGNAYVGSVVNIRIAVSKPTVALAGLEFVFDYDEEFLKPKYTQNTEEGRELDILLDRAPDKWEQMSYHSAEDGSYHFRFVMPDNSDSCLDSVGELVLIVPFTVIKAGVFEASVADRDIIAVAADAGYTTMSGVGGRLEMVAYDKAQKLAIELVGYDTAYENGSYNAVIKATNLGDTQGIIALEFALAYDKSVLSPTVTANKESEMDEFMTDMPNGAWEQMCSLDAERGIYTLRFAAVHSESLTMAESLIAGESLYITVPFGVIAAEGNIGALSVNSESVIAISGINEVFGGYGDSDTVFVEKGIAFAPEAFGYEQKDGCLLNIPEKTDVGEFLAKFQGIYITDKNGNTVTDGYVCTGYVVRDKTDMALTAVTKGDVDGNGKIDMSDYLLAKRICFSTFVPTRAELFAVAITDGEKVTSTDYMMLKRHCFGTLKIG